MTWSNLALWSAQIALLVGAAALAPLLFRLRNPQARLVYWQALLAACLLLPLVQPWERSVILAPQARPARVETAAAAQGPASPAVPASRFGWGEALAAALAAGMLLRAGWFGLGMLRLARYRRAARELDPVPAPVARLQREMGVYPEMRLSAELAGPVTFGVRDPVILLPARFPEFEPEVQGAVACHELLHVRRRDWLLTAMEEAVRMVFWFHPAVWWVLGQIQLAREQAVDREVVRLMGARERYIDALLAFSGARHQLDLAPAPLFLRRRHLTARVAAIVKESDMSRRLLYSSAAACFAVLLVAGWLVSGSLPLQAAPQYVADTPGVTVTAGSLIHRSAVTYPPEAWAKRIEGVVIVDAQLAEDGTVVDASVVAGPMELRRAALESVLKWHFRQQAGSRVQVSIEFRMPQDAGAAPPPAPPLPRAHLGVVGGVPGGGGAPAGGPPTLLKLSIEGLSPEAAEELRAKIQVREGQLLDGAAFQSIQRAVREFDRHLGVTIIRVMPRTSVPPEGPPAEAGGVVVRILPQNEIAHAAQPARHEFPPPPEGVQRIRVGGNVQAHKLVRSAPPAFPELARKAKIEGVVRLQVLIGQDGRMRNISVESGHPLLVPAAMHVAKDYEYSPTTLQGKPVEVVTTVEVPFTNP